MKKLFVNLFFLSIVTLCFSQPAFTEKTVHEINKRFIENPTNDDTAPDYVLTGSEGQKINMDQLKQMFPAVKHLTWETSDISIKQSGNIAIVNGITKHSFMSLSDNVTHYYHVRGTYVYEYKKDKCGVPILGTFAIVDYSDPQASTFYRQHLTTNFASAIKSPNPSPINLNFKMTAKEDFTDDDFGLVVILSTRATYRP
jgi:hypothetical protein